jgi:hypothetical protein
VEETNAKGDMGFGVGGQEEDLQILLCPVSVYSDFDSDEHEDAGDTQQDEHDREIT